MIILTHRIEAKDDPTATVHELAPYFLDWLAHGGPACCDKVHLAGGAAGQWAMSL